MSAAAYIRCARGSEYKSIKLTSAEPLKSAAAMARKAPSAWPVPATAYTAVKCWLICPCSNRRCRTKEHKLAAQLMATVHGPLDEVDALLRHNAGDARNERAVPGGVHAQRHLQVSAWSTCLLGAYCLIFGLSAYG